MQISRQVTIDAIRRAIENAEVFVFTLGLTEGWINSVTGEVYPMCPGTLAGDFDPTKHIFKNYRASEIYSQLNSVLQQIRNINRNIKILLTVSPVPLTATRSDNHVLVATTYSKSVLRAVAGEFAEDNSCVDYFPSYEIITAPAYRGMFYLPNNREVSLRGVEHVMTHFFAGLGLQQQQVISGRKVKAIASQNADPDNISEDPGNDIVCEDALLEAFSLKADASQA
jgi:hypothetical protein